MASLKWYSRRVSSNSSKRIWECFERTDKQVFKVSAVKRRCFNCKSYQRLNDDNLCSICRDYLKQ